MLIRPAVADDASAIFNVVQAAFGRRDEAELVERLRVERAMIAEQAAEDDVVVGHLAFSRLASVGEAPTRVAALAPLSVRPDRQRAGIGFELVRSGLERLAAAGEDSVIVLGDPAYYRRFGFTAELTRHIAAPFSGEAFVGLDLTPGALARVRSVRYANAFGAG